MISKGKSREFAGFQEYFLRGIPFERAGDGAGPVVPAGPLEPVLIVPPRLTERALATLAHAGCIARCWQLGGRYSEFGNNASWHC